MAEKYNFSNPYQLPASAQAVIPGELGQDFLSSLDQSMQAQESKQANDLLDFQQSRGLLKSGDTNYQLINQVLGPAQARREQALTGLALQGAQTGQAQNFQTQFATGQQNLATQNQMKINQQNFQDSLQAMQEQASLNQQLVRLEATLQQQMRPSFGSIFGGQFASGFGGTLGFGVAKGIENLIGLGSMGSQNQNKEPYGY